MKGIAFALLLSFILASAKENKKAFGNPFIEYSLLGYRCVFGITPDMKNHLVIPDLRHFQLVVGNKPVVIAKNNFIGYQIWHRDKVDYLDSKFKPATMIFK